MSGMYGADVGQLRQLAGQFDGAAERLDANRMTVGNAIQISAWAGPVAVRFRHHWDSEHSRKVQAAAVRLREAAHKLRANADDQERTSAVDSPGPASPVTIGAGVIGVVGGWGSRGAQAAWGALPTIAGIVGKVDTATGLAEWVNVARHAAATGQLNAGGPGLKGVVDKLDDVMKTSKAHHALQGAGRVVGGIGVGFGAIETVTRAVEGDASGAIYSGVKTAIGAAAMLPGPQQPILAAVSIGIAVGEIVYENREAIGRAARTVASGVKTAAATVARGASRALSSIGSAAKKLWPW